MPKATQIDPAQHLIIDRITCEDLELFGNPGIPGEEERSLYSFCNQCRTEGGKRVLRRRMETPWSQPEKIHATQHALRFINDHPKAFAELPPAFVAGNVDDYSRDSLPIIQDGGKLEFAREAFSLWADDDRFYIRITKGVELSCRLVRALRRFLALAPDYSAAGELQPLMSELADLLGRPRFEQITDEKTDRWFWSTLRLDQVFRLHDADSLRRLLQIIYEIDALVSLALVTQTHGFTEPKIASGPVSIKAYGLVHPFVHEAVENPVDLDQSNRVLFLTGPNMAGKTTYLRAVATSLYLAHLGMGVPAAQFSFVPVQQLLTAVSMSDDLNDGISYFRAEALRVRAVAKAVAEGKKVVAIMDEPFKGTNVKDAFDASLAILQRFSTKTDCLFMVSSHLIELSEHLDDALSISYQYFEAQESADKLEFDYVLHGGVSSQRLGMRVLEEEGIFDLLDNDPKNAL